MRSYIDWIDYTRDRFLEALKHLQDDDKVKGRSDIEIIAAASAVVFSLLQEIQVHEGEILKHLYRLHGKEPPESV